MSSKQGLEATIARLQAIDGFDFEDFVADFFEEEGWATEVTQNSDDDGVDVIAERTGVLEERAVIQAKRHAPDNKVTFGDVQRYSALVRDEHQNDMAVVVTTSSFTKKAYKYAREKNVKLMDGAAIAGFVMAHDMDGLVEDYTPDTFILKESPEEVFKVHEDSREQYFRDRPMEFAARVFEEQDLLEALDTIDTRTVGSVLIESLDEFRELIEEQSESSPTELLRSNPRLLDATWYNVTVTDEMSNRMGNRVKFSSPAGPPADVEVICFKPDEVITVCILLPFDEAITRKHLSYAEDCIDFLIQNHEISPHQVKGIVLGAEIECSSTPGTKLNRLRRFGIDAKAYEEILTRAIKANSELLKAVRPYFRSSRNEEMLEKIDRLNSYT